ncbi:ABC transporter ATP-binding protein/permease [Candidatus Pelagibacter bacterium]|nr:ABC transporter ATP-binding protein [Candidatus Pelagibacter bacterium]MDA8841431.1 ABC transporter ATP-binding protein/permease [Candidatus Pelagibacter bacterium]
MNKIETIKRLFFDYTKKHIKKILLSVFFALLVAGSTSGIAYLLDPAIEKIFIEKDQALIIIIPIFIIIAFAIKGFSLYLAKVIMIGVSEEVRKDLQCDMLNNLIAADTRLIDGKHTGKFISNITNDVSHITNLVSVAVLNLFKDSLTLIGLLTVMFFQNWKLALIAIIMIPLATFAARTLGKRISKVSTEQMLKAGILNTYLIELFKNHKLIKIFQQEKYENKRAEKFINDVKEKTVKIATVYVRSSPIMETLTGIMIAVLIFYSGKLVLKNEIDINNFFSFLAAMMLAYQPVRSLATLNITISQGLSAATRILPIIDEKSELQENKNSTEIKVNAGDVEFKNVSFKYEKERKNNTLNSVNIKMLGGKMTSIVGHSGAGKSTILNLIPRFYDAISGDIEIDNQSIYNCTISSLRKNISLVSQDTTLFDDTIRNNIAYANLGASQKEIEEAAKYSFASEFIEKLPNKYETIIGENGTRLSGGEKQRLSIARAMLKKSQIILLDEATSSLDAETENKIQDAINFLTKDRTTIVIAHRLSTILNSDKIYVIDAGTVVGEGTHDQLLANSKVYKNFYEKQIKKV